MKLTSVLIAVNVAEADLSGPQPPRERTTLGEDIVSHLRRMSVGGVQMIEARVLSETEVADFTSDFDGPSITLVEGEEFEHFDVPTAGFDEAGIYRDNVVPFPERRDVFDRTGREVGGLGRRPQTYAGGESAA